MDAYFDHTSGCDCFVMGYLGRHRNVCKLKSGLKTWAYCMRSISVKGPDPENYTIIKKQRKKNYIL